MLDEADEMLDMGFADELEAILEAAPEKRQTALFSATLPPRIAKIAERHLDDPVRVLVLSEKTPAGTLPKVRQTAYVLARAQKVPALGLVLDLEAPTLALVFCRTRHEVDSLAESLSGRGYRVEALHGGMTQLQRDRVMKRTRGGTVDVLVATDVAARGLDIEHVTHVINFDVPESPQTYVHRIGRTGRAGREGVAITFAEPREHRLLRSIESITKQKIAWRRCPRCTTSRRSGWRSPAPTSARRSWRAGSTGTGWWWRRCRRSSTSWTSPRRRCSWPIRPKRGRSRGDSARPRNRRRRRPAGAQARQAEGARSAREEAGRGGPKMVRVFIGSGKTSNMRPADLVGAIANEAGIEAKSIGTIEIAERFSLVELPEELVDEVIKALRARPSRASGRRSVATRRTAGAPSPGAFAIERRGPGRCPERRHESRSSCPGDAPLRVAAAQGISRATASPCPPSIPRP